MAQVDSTQKMIELLQTHKSMFSIHIRLKYFYAVHPNIKQIIVNGEEASEGEEEGESGEEVPEVVVVVEVEELALSILLSTLGRT